MEEQDMTSSQFAALCGITKDALIWYEKKGLIKPVWIGENGYHYFSYDQYFDIDLIKTMRNAGLSLEECRKYMQDRSANSYMKILQEQQELLSRQITELRLLKTDLDITIRDCLSMVFNYGDKPQIVHRKESYYLAKPLEKQGNEGIVRAFEKLFSERKRIQQQYKTCSTMLNSMVLPFQSLMDREFEKPCLVCLQLNEFVPESCCVTFPEGEYAILYHSGTRENIAESYCRLLDYIESEHAEPCGDAIESDFINHLANSNEKEHIKQISIPVKKL